MIKRYCDLCKKEEDIQEDIQENRRVMSSGDAGSWIAQFSTDDSLKNVLLIRLMEEYPHICTRCLERIDTNLRKYLTDIADELISKGLGL